MAVNLHRGSPKSSLLDAKPKTRAFLFLLNSSEAQTSRQNSRSKTGFLFFYVKTYPQSSELQGRINILENYLVSHVKGKEINLISLDYFRSCLFNLTILFKIFCTQKERGISEKATPPMVMRFLHLCF